VYLQVMKMRGFAGGGARVSEVGLGTWQLGGTEWGEVPRDRAMATLHAAADAGVTFIDTADIYGSGRSEQLIGQFLRDRGREGFFIATKLGRRPDPGWPENFRPEVVRRHTEDSLRRLGIDAVDLTQTHCIPMEMLDEHRVFDTLRKLRDEGLVRHFGASVESMDEALACLDRGVESLQIIFNIFRRKPADVLFERARRERVAVIVRLPVASGLLAGRFTKDTKFVETDHRHFNRDGQAFNVGETFAGLAFETGVELADALKRHVPAGWTMAQWAMRWCLDFEAVTTVIPGATRPQQARENAAACDLPPLDAATHRQLADFYTHRVAPHIRGVY
jgi:aryl-alcohol dehydrogenase-like predicted oxidoreductase